MMLPWMMGSNPQPSSSSSRPQSSTTSRSSSQTTIHSSSLSTLLLISFTLIFSSFAQLASSTNDQQLPSIDWSTLGTVAILGSFSTLSFYNSTISSTFTSTSNQTAYLLTHSLKQQADPPKLPRIIASTGTTGSINTICTSKSNKVYIGGRFDSLNSTPFTSNVAVYDPKSHSISSLSNSTFIQGTVHAISCSNEDQIWIAGQFQNPISSNQNPNIVTWSSNSGFQSPSNPNLPTFNGPIYSLDLLTTPTGQSLIIGGQFTVPINTDNRSAISNSLQPSRSNSNQIGNDTIDTNSNRLMSLGSAFAPIPLSNEANWSASPPSSDPSYQSPTNIFCPTGPDGPGNSWQLDSSANVGLLTLNLGTSVPAGGIRLANSFINGGGTAGFHIVSIPNDQILNLSFINPITNQLDTCSTNCTLSRDLTIPYQDFLFPPNTVLEGIQFVITSKFGNVAGLHLLQLLSQGNTAYAVDRLNSGRVCRAGIGAASGQNSAKTTGVWNSINVNTQLPGIVQPVLVASVPSGTKPEDAPTLTWTVSVPQSGNYELILQTPGCSGMNDCSSRTSLAATVASIGIPPLTTIIDTRNPNDLSSTLYNGTLMDTSASGGQNLTVTLRLANSLTGSSSVTMVANQLILKSTSLASHLPGVLSTGVYEHILAGNGAFGDGSVPNSTAGQTKEAFTSVDQLGAHLRLGSAVRSVIADDRTLFVAGDRLSVLNGTSSVATTSTTVPNGGLNGTVHTLVTFDGVLYAGGSFTATADSLVQGLNGLARWKYGQSSPTWEPFPEPGSTVGTPIQAFEIIDGLIYVFGSSRDSGRRSLGIFNPHNSTWVQSTVGVYFGQLTASAAQTGDDPMLYIAGNLNGIGATEAPSGALLSTGSGDTPSLTGLNFQINQTASQVEALALRVQTQTVPSSLNTTSITNPSNGISTRSTLVRRFLRRRQLNPSNDINSSNLNISLPYSVSRTNGATILTGAFSKEQELLIGGRFVSSNSVSNIGIYDLSMSALRPLNGTNKLNGAVLSIKVVDDVAWIGGLFVSPSGKSGLDTYNLTSGQWATEMMANVSPYSTDTNVSVRAIKSRTTGDVIVGGRFQQVGRLSCPSICMWSGTSNQWLNLGNGLKGVVNAIEIFGKDQEQILAVGRFEVNQTLTDGAIAKWTLNSPNPTWLPIGSQDKIPGTVRTIALGELDQGETDGMFIAGQRTLGGGSFLMNWKQEDWVIVEGLNEDLSQIDDIAFVPIKDPSTTISTVNGVKSDRLLLVSGWIVLKGLTTKTGGALYDGQNWYPYLTPIDYNGQSGVLSKMISSNGGFRSALRHIHSVVAVIFISMAIALGIVLIGSLIGFLIGYWRGRKEKKSGMCGGMEGTLGGGSGVLEEDEEDEDGIGIGGVGIPGNSRRSSGIQQGVNGSRRTRRPASLLATIDAATTAMAERMQSKNKINRNSKDEVRLEEKRGFPFTADHQDHYDPQEENQPRLGDGNRMMPVGTGIGGMMISEKNLESGGHHNVNHDQDLINSGTGLISADPDSGSSDEDHPQLQPPMINTFGQIEDPTSSLNNLDQVYLDNLDDDDLDIRRARWSFDPQLPGEIAVAAGESVQVKDRSNQEWWLVKREDGIEGVVPADWFL